MNDRARWHQQDRETKEALDALALRAYESQHRERRRMAAWAIRIVLFVVFPFALFVVWLTMIGYQRHVLEVHVGDTGFRIISHRSPFEVSVPSEDFGHPIPGDMLVQTEKVNASSIQPRLYIWSSYSDTKQVVTLPGGVSTLDFWVNEVHFEMAAGEVVSGERRWLMRPGQLVNIEVDRLPATLPSPPPGSAPVKPSR